MQIAEAVSFLTAQLKEWDIETPFYEAELFLMHFLAITRTQLHMSPETEITPTQWAQLRSALERRLKGEPMAYILGYRDFYKMRFNVGPGVLIPRPETELIIDAAIERGPFSHIADLGCGSGCIGLSLLGEFPNARLWTCDISDEALAYFQENAKQLNFMGRIDYSLGDARENKAENKYDLVVSNPPYIDLQDQRVERDVRDFEPSSALFANDNGLEFYKAWFPWAQTALKIKGWILFEFGEGQGRDIFKLAEDTGFINITLKKDLAGKERIICAQKE